MSGFDFRKGRPMSVRNLAICAVLIFFPWGQSWAIAVDRSSPTGVVQTVVDKVLTVLKEDSLEQEARRAKIRELIAPHFDFHAMSRSILAQNWKKASPQQRDRFIELFSNLLENTYIVAMEAYTNQKIIVGPEKRKGRRALVKTVVEQDTGVTTPINFRMRQNADGWYAYDVIIEGVSLVSNYRSTFRTIVKRDGMDGLLTQLAEKVEKE